LIFVFSFAFLNETIEKNRIECQTDEFSTTRVRKLEVRDFLPTTKKTFTDFIISITKHYFTPEVLLDATILSSWDLSVILCRSATIADKGLWNRMSIRPSTNNMSTHHRIASQLYAQ
jgi:hypothetical protein